MRTIPLAEYRCTCGRLLFKGITPCAYIQIKCRRCGTLVWFGQSAFEEGSSRYGFVTDTAGKILNASESASTILGYTQSELSRMSMEDLSPYSAPSYEEGSFTIDATRGRFESAHRTKSGETVTVHVYRELHSAAGTPQVLYVCDLDTVGSPLLVIRDTEEPPVTKHTCVLEVDTRGVITYANRACEALLGSPKQSLIGQSIFDRINQGDEYRYRRWFMEMAAERMAYTLHDMCVTKQSDSDAQQVLRIHHAPAYHDDGLLRGYSLIIEQDPPAGDAADVL